jgi:hypothetical protein
MEKQRPLTDGELDAVTDVIAAEGEVSGLVALWAVLLGYPLANHPGQLRPGDYAIPEVQWRKIAAAMIATTIAPTDFPGFTMVNSGPSGYEPTTRVSHLVDQSKLRATIDRLSATAQ